MKKRKSIKYRWYIAYIDGEHLSSLKKELKRIPNAENVEAYIPTIKVLKKEKRGKRVFERLPLLPGYGFFKVPVSWANNLEFMASLQSGITCLISWVKDPTRLLDSDSPQPSRKERKAIAPIAVATREEIQRLIDEEEKLGVHNKADLHKLKPGDVITLRGKPFDGLEAVILGIDFERRKVEVSIGADSFLSKVKVGFENVFYSVYTGDMDERVGRHYNIDDCYATGTLDNFEITL